MMFLPVALKVEGVHVLVVGGGAVAARKVRSLLECSAKVHIVAPQLGEELQALQGQLEYSPRRFQDDDCEGCALVFACTDDTEVNAQIAAIAKTNNIWCQIADDATGSTLTGAATIRRGEICIGVTTGGGSPALAKHLKGKIEECVGDEYAQILQLMSARRETLKLRFESQSERARVWQKVLAGEALQLLREGKTEEAEALIENQLSSKIKDQRSKIKDQRPKI